MSPTIRRLCPGCRVTLVTSGRCPACQRLHDQARDARRGTTTARGLGWSYQRRREYVLNRDLGRCWICGEYGADTVDHVIPRSRGGSSHTDNLKAAHAWCNASRGAS